MQIRLECCFERPSTFRHNLCGLLHEAFVSVVHAELLAMLSRYGICDQLIAWIND